MTELEIQNVRYHVMKHSTELVLNKFEFENFGVFSHHVHVVFDFLMGLVSGTIAPVQNEEEEEETEDTEEVYDV